MIDSLPVLQAIALAALLLSLSLVLLVVVAIVRRATGRSIAPRWRRLAAAVFGGYFGFGLLLFGGDPLLQALLLGAVVMVWVWLIRRARRVDAGWLALGVALPWTVLSAWDLALGGVDVEPPAAIGSFLLGAIPVVIAAAVVARGDPPSPEPRPDAPIGQPGSRRVGHLSATFRDAMSVGPVTTMELAGFTTVALIAVAVGWLPVPLDPLARAVALVVIGTLVAPEVALRSMPGRVRRALEAYSWLGEWELGRQREQGLGSPLAGRADAERWLARFPDRPDNRWLRWEVLLFLGRLDEAEEAAAGMPQATPYERFERTYALERVAWGRGGAGDPASLRAAAKAVGPISSDDRLRAELAIAMREAQRRAADGGDALAPLVAARDLLGPRPDVGIGGLFRGRTRTAMLVTTLFVAAIAYLLDPVADLLVTAFR